MTEDFFQSEELKKELKKYYLNLSRGSGLQKIKKTSQKEMTAFEDKFYHLSGKAYLAKNAGKRKLSDYEDYEIIALGKKYPAKAIFSRLLKQEKINFSESGFENPQEKCRIIQAKGFYNIKTPANLFSSSTSANFLKEVEDKIYWPRLSYAFPAYVQKDTNRLADIVCDFLLSIGVARQGLMNESEKNQLKEEIKYFIENDEPIRISYYLFCGKIGNPSKVNRRSPNLADYYGLYKLTVIEKELRNIYKPTKSAFAIEWYVLDQTFVQRFDIAKGQEIFTRKIYHQFIKRLRAEEYIHLIPWENLIEDMKEFIRETKRLQKVYVKDYANFLKKKEQPAESQSRGERIAERIHSAYGIVNPFCFPAAKINIDDLLVLYNNFFPGLHFSIHSETPCQLELISWVKKQAIWESAQYLGSLEARKTVSKYALNLPKNIPATVTRKKGRFVLDYLGCGKVEGSRFFPDVGEAVIFPNKEITIMPYLSIISYPSKFIPVYIKEFGEKTPFFWLTEDFQKR